GVQTCALPILTLKSSFFPRSDKANGNSFGSPNNVNPLNPKFIPSSIHEAASSADTTLSKKSLFLIFWLKSTLMKNHLLKYYLHFVYILTISSLTFMCFCMKGL